MALIIVENTESALEFLEALNPWNLSLGVSGRQIFTSNS